MKNILLPVLLLAAITGCNAQSKQKPQGADTTGAQANAPKVTWKVNKKFDDKGNLVSYDSSSVWTYSTHGTQHSVEADSVMMAFKKQFDASFPSMFRSNFGDPMWNDSLFFRDFTAPDYFGQKWRQHYFDMDNMMRQMDSLRNSFLKKNYPGLSNTHED